MEGFRIDEKYLSQIPALQLLINLGFTYLPPEQASRARGKKASNVILEEILRERLKKNNSIQFKGQSYLFSEENIQSAIQRIKSVKYDGLLKTNEAIYDMLTLGVALEQTIEGDSKSYTLNYIDWKNWGKNDFHVTAEFPVDRNRRDDTCRPDIVLFVNGIPFVVIECKSPKIEIKQAVSQMIRNQRDEYIPKLFIFTQLLLALNKNDGKYATVGTPAKFWAQWREDDDDQAVTGLINKSLSVRDKDILFLGEAAKARIHFETMEKKGDRLITEQDRVIYRLCQPERLLDLTLQFTVFEVGVRKIARYPQFFTIKEVLKRVKEKDEEGRRQGGIIWHTQGSGKSLTMVMLARALALDPDIPNPRIVLVTDRVDLDKQLGNTFAACGLLPERADSGRHLLELVSTNNAQIITTLIHKFDKALSLKKHIEESENIFVLVDESHRTNFGNLAARMRQMFPKACFLGFTGTPLMKKEKNNFLKFGELIRPFYSIKQGVEDGAIVPLLYEARHVEIRQNKTDIDTWFERHTARLNDLQKVAFKKKFSSMKMLDQADQVIYMRAFDISEHYSQNWQSTGYKAQLVAPSKAAALTYKRFLDEIGNVSSEVIISPPDIREGNEEVEAPPVDKVVEFWEKMMKRYGSEEEYNRQIISQFKDGDEPEILIVVDKLITGFDAPRNAVLYLTRKLREHTLLQAVARVNRLYEDEEDNSTKEYGYIIDYAGILGELDHALTTYSALEGFDENDLSDALMSINKEVAGLPQCHADLWDIFKEIKNHNDEEAYERLLADEKLRAKFYERLSSYSKVLAIALSSEQFLASTDEQRLQAYKNDLKRFTNLKASVKFRYAESISNRDFDRKIKKLLDTHIIASEVIQLNEPVNIFDDAAFKQVVEEQGESKPVSAKADIVAHAAKKAIAERLEQDPGFYQKFSEMIQKTIDDFRAGRISDMEYFNKASEIKDSVVHRNTDDYPTQLASNENAIALYGILRPYVGEHMLEEEKANNIAADIAIDIWSIIQQNKKVGFWEDDDAQKDTVNQIDDYLYDEVRENKGVLITTSQMDEIIRVTMQLAKNRMRGKP